MFKVFVASAVALAHAQDLKFLSIGDWGDSGAKEIAGYMGDLEPDWVLGIGDNFYNQGVTGVDDPQFTDKFENTFTADSLQVPWYLCAGNHDYYGGDKGIAAEIAYSDKSSRWKFPSFYFDEIKTGKDGTTAHLFSIDTWRINGGDALVTFDPATESAEIRNNTDLDRRFREGVIEETTYKLVKSSYNSTNTANPLKASPDQKQLDWLTSTLKASTADWKIVFGHFPVYSATTSEHGDTANLVKWLLPILSDNKVDAYFNGHDHILQHIYRDSVHFLGSGSGARKHTGVNTKYTGLQGYHEDHYGFMYHTLSKTEFTTQFVDDNNDRPYNFTITH